MATNGQLVNRTLSSLAAAHEAISRDPTMLATFFLTISSIWTSARRVYLTTLPITCRVRNLVPLSGRFSMVLGGDLRHVGIYCALLHELPEDLHDPRIRSVIVDSHPVGVAVLEEFIGVNQVRRGVVL